MPLRLNDYEGVKTDPKGWGTTVDNVYLTCCSLNGPIGLAHLPLITVMRDAQGLVVNLYNSGNVQLTDGATGKMQLSVKTNYPRDGAILVNVVPDTPRRFVIKLRIPAWSQATDAKVNGARLSGLPGSYLSIDREWKAGDLIELNLDMRCRLVRAKMGSTPGSDRYHALLRGPIVLARDENIDPQFNQPVDIVAHGGIVDIKPVTPMRADASMQFEVPTRSGAIQMVNYASVNSWAGKRVQTWLPMAT